MMVGAEDVPVLCAIYTLRPQGQVHDGYTRIHLDGLTVKE